MDDVWFTEDAMEVRLRVNPEAARYLFAVRCCLNSSNDKIVLFVASHYALNHIYQLLPVVLYRLPHVQIVQPVERCEELRVGLQQVLAQ